MTNAQLYFLIAVPILTALVQASFLNKRMDKLEERIDKLDTRLDGKLDGLRNDLRADLRVLDTIVFDHHGRIAKIEEKQH